MLLDNELIKKYGISSNGLKILAFFLMLTDHVGAVLLPQYRILRYIGRLAFPIYCFLITEGFIYTKSISRYAVRLLVFAIISEIPFDLAIFGKFPANSDQNVYFTLLLGLIAIWLIEILTDNGKKLAAVIMCMLMAEILKVDYTFYGVLMICLFYMFRDNVILMTSGVALVNLIMGAGGTGSQKYAVFAMLFLFLYSGKKNYMLKDNGECAKNSAAGKWIFYLVYPVHLIVLYMIKTYGGCL